MLEWMILWSHLTVVYWVCFFSREGCHHLLTEHWGQEWESAVRRKSPLKFRNPLFRQVGFGSEYAAMHLLAFNFDWIVWTAYLFLQTGLFLFLRCIHRCMCFTGAISLRQVLINQFFSCDLLSIIVPDWNFKNLPLIAMMMMMIIIVFFFWRQFIQCSRCGTVQIQGFFNKCHLIEMLNKWFIDYIIDCCIRPCIVLCFLVCVVDFFESCLGQTDCIYLYCFVRYRQYSNSRNLHSFGSSKANINVHTSPGGEKVCWFSVGFTNLSRTFWVFIIIIVFIILRFLCLCCN